MKSFLVLLFCSCSLIISAQTIFDIDHAWQEEYKREFLTDPRSPVKGNDTSCIRFFNVDGKYVFDARIKRTPNAKPFLMATHSGKSKMYRQYGILTVLRPLMVVDVIPVWMHGKASKFKLHVYQRVTADEDTTNRNMLFIPFTDKTNGVETYGGGRYLDIKTTDFRGRWMRLDFNKAYNPWCAFGEGFSCPIPPAENRLHIAMRAGEMLPAPPLLHSE